MVVASLVDRYSISRSVLYKRLNALQIKPSKVRLKTYVSAEQLELLDALDKRTKSKGSKATFLESRGLLRTKPVTVLETAQPETSITLQWTTRLEYLQKAYEKGWLLSMSQLVQLLDIPVPLLLGNQPCAEGQVHERYGFRFTKAGMNGLEIAWKISKS